MKTLTRDDTQHGVEYVLKSEALDAISEARYASQAHADVPEVPCGNPAQATAAQGELVAQEAVQKLRSALNGMLMFFGMDEEDHSKEVFDKAREALAEPIEPYLLLAMGHGTYEVGAGTNGGLPCIAWGRNGTGKVGELLTLEPRQMTVEETVAVITFANVEGLEVLQEKVDEVRRIYFGGEAQPAPVVADAPSGRDVLMQVFALCEATEGIEAPLNLSAEHFTSGRRFEAKGIRKAIGTWFQDAMAAAQRGGE